MKKFPLFFLFLISLSCATTPKKGFEVEYRGEMRKIMQQGDISARADLIDLKDTENLYALGAAEGLKGEILILDGDAYISSVQEEKLEIDNTYDYKATLLVYASVKEWKEHKIPAEVSTLADLEKYVAQLAAEQGLDPEKPFPFLLEGTVRSFGWHVINWKEDDTIHTHEKHKNSGLRETAKNKAVEILGFYSNSHHGVFTHHSTNMHLHVRTKDNAVAGHLDELNLGQNMILKFPIN